MTNNKTGLLEASKQTLQLMEFVVAGGHYGINVAKVSHIMKYNQHPITPMPNSNPFVEGIFKPRDDTMTVINLAAYMGLPPSEDEEHDILIITKFNNVQTAFHIHGVEAIDVVPLTDIEKPDPTIYGGDESMATGVAKFNDRLITIIDFEKVLIDISPSLGFDAVEMEKFSSRDSSLKPILVAEDSPLLERLIISALEKAGYINIVCTSNGHEAWNLLQEYKSRGGLIEDYVAAVITDIEMPLMDGHSLIKLLKSDSVYDKIPVFVFSSIITDEMREKGASLGIVDSISKPEIGKLVSLLDQYLQ